MTSYSQSLCDIESLNNDGNEMSFIRSNENEEYSCEKDYLVKSIAEILNQIITDFEGEKNENKKKLDIFLSPKQPKISLFDYLKRFVKYSKIEKSTIICCLIYLDRMCDLNSVTFTKNNVHKLLLGTIVLAIKFNEDDYYSNDFYAKVGGISIKELNRIESQTLCLLKYQLHIDTKFFNKYHAYLKQYKLKEVLDGN